MVVFDQGVFIRAKWLHSGKVVKLGEGIVFGQKWLHSGKTGCIRAKVVVVGQSGCIRSRCL